MEPAKLLLPYLQRADELQKHEPLVAYYCRLYAMERGLKMPPQERTKTTNALLVSLMNQLEKDKKSIALGPEDNLYVEGFALNVFAKADKQDRAGRADLNTAKTFYAASIFFEILHQFGELQPDIEQKQKYAVWKAADIRKALSEGKKPQPGPPSTDEELDFTTEKQDVENAPLIANATKHTERVEPPAERAENMLNVSRSVDDILLSTATNWQHNSDAITPFTSSHPVQPLTGLSSGYPAAFSDLNYRKMPDRSGISPSPANPLQYGSGTSSGTSDIQQFTDSHHSYSLPSHSGETRSQPPPSSYSPPLTDNSASGASFYQNSEYSAVPPYSVNPTAAYLSPHYGLYPSGQGVTGYNDSIPTNRTISAPAVYDKPSSASVTRLENNNYQPPSEKIAEAHKASRFAVSALAFDDVPTAVSFLERALELLTNPSASVQ